METVWTSIVNRLVFFMASTTVHMKALIGPDIKFFVDRFRNRFDLNPLNP